MNTHFSDVMLYLAGLFVIQSVLLLFLRRFKIPDFMIYLITGLLLGALSGSWSGREPGRAGDLLSEHYQLTTAVRGILVEHAGDPESAARIDSLTLPPLPEALFLERLAEHLGKDRVNPLSRSLLRAGASPTHSPGFLLLQFLSTLGLLLFFMHLGANFDRRFLQLIRNPHFLIQAAIVVVPLAGGLGLGGYFLLFDHTPLPLLLWGVPCLSVNIGALLAVCFPVRPVLKESVSRLILLAVVLDALAIAGYAWALLLENYRPAPGRIWTDAPYWLLLCAFAAMMIWQNPVERARRWLHRRNAEFTILLRFALILIFIYAGLRIDFPLLLLGLGAGILFQTLFGEADHALRQRFFAGAAFLYVLPFAAAGHALFSRLMFDPQIWIAAGLMLMLFALIAAVVGLAWIWQNENPWVMALGSFPRGEIALLILWMFKQQHLISTSVFLSTALAIVFSTLLGLALSAVLFGKNRVSPKKLKIS